MNTLEMESLKILQQNGQNFHRQIIPLLMIVQLEN